MITSPASPAPITPETTDITDVTGPGPGAEHTRPGSPEQPERNTSTKRVAAIIFACFLASFAIGYVTGRFILGADETQAVDHGSYAVQGELAIEPAVVNDIVSYVESETGRSFLFQPVIVAQSDTEFAEGLAALAEANLDTEDMQVAARYLQLVHADSTSATELEQIMVDVTANAPLGYYDPATDRIYVPITGGDTPELRATIVHELVHALDDQYVDLEEMLGADAEPSTEQSAINRMVIEGRATSIERAWRAENDVPVEIEDLPAALDDVPPAILIDLSLPYELGSMYIDAVGGAAESWDLLENPPATSDALLSPAPGEPKAAPSPDANGSELERWDVGAYEVLTLLLGNDLNPDPTTTATAFIAAGGWAGGEAVLSGDEADSCLNVSLVTDTPEALTVLADAFTNWAEEVAGRQAEIDGEALSIESCAPFLP